MKQYFDRIDRKYKSLPIIFPIKKSNFSVGTQCLYCKYIWYVCFNEIDEMKKIHEEGNICPNCKRPQINKAN